MGSGTTLLAVGLLLTPLALPVAHGSPRPGVGRVQDVELRDFQRAFKPTRDPLGARERRRAALAALTGALAAEGDGGRPATARALLDAYDQVEQELLPLAERHLDAVRRDQAANGAEHRPLLDAQRELQDLVLGAVASIEAPEGRRQLLLEVLERDRLPLTLRLHAARTGPRIEPDRKLLDRTARALRARRDVEGVLVALEVTRALGPGAAGLGGELARLLGHERTAVRVRAARGLAAMRQADWIEVLVDALERERGRPRVQVAAAREELTGRRLGTSPVSWRRWLEREGPAVADAPAAGGSSGPNGPGGPAGSGGPGGSGGSGGASAGGAAEGRSPDESARYHGIPIDGDAILFVLDRSKSMNKRLARTRGALRTESAGASAERRFDRAKRELIATLGALGPDKRFGVLAFGATVTAFEERPVPARAAELSRAVDWIEGLQLQAGTNAYGALETAFHHAGRGAEDRDFEAAYDTLFLLSDGLPFLAGERDSVERILSQARRWNATGQLVLHTVGLGDEVPTGFMGTLARDHGGRFVLETGTGGVDLSSRPNLVLFLVDDLGWRDVGFAGNEVFETPAVDRLADGGVRFESAYSNAPNCAPSRASLLTGLYTPRHGIYTVLGAARGPAEQRALVPVTNTTSLGAGFTTLAEVLSDAGYATASIGKWHLGDDPREHGFDLNVAGTRSGHPESYFSPYGNEALADGPPGESLTERLTDEALGFIRSNAERPFFLYLSHYAVHTPLQAPEELERKYAARTETRREATYAAMVESVDASLGRVLGLLDELDLAERTVVCFTSDNGALEGVTSMEPLRGQKGHIEEAGIRVPLVVRWPGRIPAGESVRTPVIGSDLFPTFVQLAGASAPPVDGESLVPLLLGDGTLDRKAIFWHFPAYLEPYGSSTEFRARPCGAVRRGRYKLIEHFEDGRLELFDLREDPGEASNLAEERPDLRAELHGVLREWREEVGAPVPTEPNPDFRR